MEYNRADTPSRWTSIWVALRCYSSLLRSPASTIADRTEPEQDPTFAGSTRARLYQGTALTAPRCPICGVWTDDPDRCLTCLGGRTLGTAILQLLALLFAVGCWGSVAALFVL